MTSNSPISRPSTPASDLFSAAEFEMEEEVGPQFECSYCHKFLDCSASGEWSSVCSDFHGFKYTFSDHIIWSNFSANCNTYVCLHEIVSQINGNNGEATNTDDLAESGTMNSLRFWNGRRYGRIPNKTNITRAIAQGNRKWRATVMKPVDALLGAAGSALGGVATYGILDSKSKEKPKLVGIEENPGPGPSKAQRKVQSDRDKAIAKSLNKMKKKGATVGVSRSSKVKGNTYATGTPVVSQTSNTIEKISIRGFKVKLDQLISPATILGSGQVMFTFTVDRLLFARKALKPIFQLFNNWFNKGITFEVVPAAGTNTAGNVQSVVDTDASDLPIIGNVMDDSYFSGHGRKNQEHSVFGEIWRVKLPSSNRKLFTDIPRTTNASASISDPRLSSAGVITIATSSGFALTNTNIGSLWVIFNGDFQVSDYSEDDAVVSMVKAGSTSANSLASGITQANFATLLNTVKGSGLTGINTSIYSEYSYENFFFDGTQFNLPRGVWYFKFFVGFGSAPGTCTFNLNLQNTTGLVISTDFLGTSNQTNALIPEYTITGVSFASQTGSAQMQGVVRVVNGSQGSPYMQFKPTVTLQNTVNAVTLQIVCYRLPSSTSEQYNQQFPFGNNGTGIELRDGEVTKYFKCEPASAHHFSISQSEYLEFQEYRARKDQPICVDVNRDDEKSVLGSKEFKTPPTDLQMAYTYPSRLGVGWFK